MRLDSVILSAATILSWEPPLTIRNQVLGVSSLLVLSFLGYFVQATLRLSPAVVHLVKGGVLHGLEGLRLKVTEETNLGPGFSGALPGILWSPHLT